MTRKEQKAQTKAAVMGAAAAAFRHNGYEEVTLRGIAKAADVSTGAVYSFWDSKAEMYAEVMGRPAPDVGSFLARVAVVCAGYPGDVGVVASEAEELRRVLIGHHG